MTISFWRRTFGELGYALLALPMGIAGFVLTVTTLSVGGGLSVTVVGLPILAAAGIACRELASWYRAVGNRLLVEDLPAPGPSGRGWFRGGLLDASVWKARVYLVLKLPLGIAAFVSAAVCYVYGLGAVTYAAWRPFLPRQHGHRGMQLWNHHYVDTAGWIALLALVGAALLAAAPFVVRAFVSLDRAVTRGLVGRAPAEPINIPDSVSRLCP